MEAAAVLVLVHLVVLVGAVLEQQATRSARLEQQTLVAAVAVAVREEAVTLAVMVVLVS